MSNVKTKEQLEEIIATAQQALADLDKPKRRVWKPEGDEKCFVLYSSGVMLAATFNYRNDHPNYFARGRIAKTREELEKKDRKDVALKRINDAVIEASGDWVADWGDGQGKYTPCYVHHKGCWNEVCSYGWQANFHFLLAPVGVYEKLFVSHADDFKAFL